MIKPRLIASIEKNNENMNFAILQNYASEMSRTDLPAELRGQKYTIFGNIEPIYRFHASLLLPALQERLAQPFDSIGKTTQGI